MATLVVACTESATPLPPVSVCFEPAGALPAPSSACAPGAPATPYPVVDGGCDLGPPEPGHLVVTTTDFSTGAVSVADAGARSVVSDVALGSSDAIPFYRGGLLYLVHRFQIDFIDVLDPCDGFASRGQFPIEIAGVPSTNPNSIAFRDDGLAFVPLFANPRVAVVDFARGHAGAVVDWIDTSRFADGDGNPEASLAIACGDTLFVNARRLDPAFEPTGPELLFAVDGRTCQPYDDAIELLGSYVKKARPDPADPSGRTVLLLTTGIERVDLAAGTVEWALSAATLEAAGIAGLQLQAFDLDADGNVYLAAYDEEFTEVAIWRGALGGTGLERLTGGLNAVESTLEIVGTQLWFGDTTPARAGLRVYDLAGGEPELVAGPLGTGLPPYTLIAVP